MALRYVEIPNAFGMKFLPGFDDLNLAKQNLSGVNTYLAELDYLRVIGEVYDNAVASRLEAIDYLERVVEALEYNGGGRI